MLEESAMVVAVDGDFAWVETQRKSSCGSCSARNACGTATLQKVMGNRRNQMKVLNPIAASEGEQVTIGLKEEALLKGSFMVYLMPLILMFAMAILFEQVFSAEGWTILGGLLGLVLGFWGVALFGRRVAHDECYQAVILKRAEPGQSVVKIKKDILGKV